MFSRMALVRAVATDGPAGAALQLRFESPGPDASPEPLLLGRARTADDALRLARLVALTFPVDYWDYLGWKDTLAQRMFTARQKGYGETRGDRGGNEM